MMALLEARPPTLLERIDVVRGAVDARLHPQLTGAPRIRDRRAFAPLVGFALFWVAIAVASIGSLHRDSYGEYRDGSMAIPLLILAMILLAVGLYEAIVRVPRDDRLTPVAGVVAIVTGITWMAMPWVVPIAIAFLASVLILAVGVRRAGLWSISEAALVVFAGVVPAGILLAQLFLPWYAMRVAGFNLLLILAPLSCMWLAVGFAGLRRSGRPDWRTSPA
jgi:hypothetical protein